MIVTLLRTKDPRFTMPLLGPLMVLAGAWLASWGSRLWAAGLKACIVAALCLQAYAANFGMRWLPQEVVLARGYRGSVTWNWNLYLQHYFHILGRPKREDWQQEAILREVAADASRSRARAEVAIIPDLARFNSVNFQLVARLRGLHVRVDHLGSTARSISSFDGYNYVIMTERDQGMSWTTGNSLALNQIVVDDPKTFRLLGLYLLPDGNCARLYRIERASSAALGKESLRIRDSRFAVRDWQFRFSNLESRISNCQP